MPSRRRETMQYGNRCSPISALRNSSHGHQFLHVLPTSGQQPAARHLNCLWRRLRTLWRPAANHAVAVSSRLAANAEGGFLGHPTQHDRGEIDCEPAAEKNATRLPTTDRSAYAVWETTYPMEISTHVAAAFVRSGHLWINQRGCPMRTTGQKPDRPLLL